MKRASTRQLFGAVLCLMFLSNYAASCSFVFIPVNVRPSFTIKVVDYRERPVGNIELTVVKGDVEVRHFRSDSSGKVAVQLPLGNYYVTYVDPIKGPGWGHTSLAVIRDSKAKSEVTMHWPQGPVLAVRTLSGRLRSVPHIEGMNLLQRMQRVNRLVEQTYTSADVEAVADTKVELFDLSGQQVAQTKTDGVGHFDVPPVPEGIYYLRFPVHGFTEKIFVDFDGAFADSLPNVDIVVGDLTMGSDLVLGYYVMNKK